MKVAETKPGKGALQAWVRALEAIKVLEERPDLTLTELVLEAAAGRRDAPALIGEHGRLSYGELAARIEAYTQWGLRLPAGTVVALLMPNCPDYAALWMGLTRTGCVVALLNTNLTGAALAHSIRAAGASRVIVSAGLRDRVADETPVIVFEETEWFPGGDLEEVPAARRPAGADTALMIYTSGTTGLPKAANVPHRRLAEWSLWFAGMIDARPEDRLYDCLPMYHSVGGVVGIGAMLVRGGSVLIRERFSASRFWDDIVQGGCTIFQYIGELCRYLNNAPAREAEGAHRLRLAFGNGLRGDVWEIFQTRFGIPQILEFYAATEGSVSLYNCEGRPGAIGRVPAFLAHRFPLALIKVDDDGTPVRDADGRCVACDVGEAGEAIGRVPAGRGGFYTDAAASAKKVLRDAFAAGDAWFRTGDVMRKDGAGYYYFVDRLGDTFRWKGENVSTTEVAGVVAACPGVTEAVVYGVAVPGHEGRAGMAAITVDAGFEMAALPAFLAGALPEYARPIFVRICPALEVTGTFKFRTAELARDGLAAAGVWFWDRASGAMVPCDEDLRGRIGRMEVRF